MLYTLTISSSLPKSEADKLFEDMKAFDLKDLSVAVKFVGIKIEHKTAHNYSMSKRTMILILIKHFGLKNTNPVRMPVAEVVFSA